MPPLVGWSAGLVKVTYVKRTILEFIGGCWDGMNLCTFSADEVEAELAIRTCVKTGDGMVGREVVMPGGYAVRCPGQGRKYLVVYRVEALDEVLVRLECFERPQASPPPEPSVTPVTLQFAGGPMDEVKLDSRSPNGDEVLAAMAYYLLTDAGSVGARCPSTMGSPLLRRDRAHRPPFVRPVRDHEYCVVRRTERDKCIAVELQYLPQNRPEAATGESQDRVP